MHIEILYEYVHVMVKVEVNLPCECHEGTCAFLISKVHGG